MPDRESNGELLQRLIGGDHQAAREFWQDQTPQLERLAKRHIAQRLQRRIGAEDVVQSVCRTFVRRSRAGEFDVPDADSLKRLLYAITLTKVRERVRFHLRQRRSVLREAAQPADRGDGSWSPLDQGRDLGPPPDEAVAFSEGVQQLLDALTEEERTLVHLRLEGRTQDEIADTLQCSERTVRRLLTRVREKWTRELRDNLDL